MVVMQGLWTIFKEFTLWLTKSVILKMRMTFAPFWYVVDWVIFCKTKSSYILLYNIMNYFDKQWYVENKTLNKPTYVNFEQSLFHSLL